MRFRTDRSEFELDNGIERKWVWAVKRCELAGLEEASRCAKEIDRIVEAEYGNIHTIKWANLIRSMASDTILSLKEIRGIILNVDYCTPCSERKLAGNHEGMEMSCCRFNCCLYREGEECDPHRDYTHRTNKKSLYRKIRMELDKACGIQYRLKKTEEQNE